MPIKHRAPGSSGAYLQLRNWQHKWGERTLLMGIVNVTADSFSGDGVLDVGPQQAVSHALQMLEHGADIIDIGGESTRPGHTPVSIDQELERVLPALSQLRKQSDCLISIDTTKPEVLRQALAQGADILNCISSLSDELLECAVQAGIPVVITHNKDKAVYDGDVMNEVVSSLKDQAERAIACGIRAGHVILDPGIGFGKTAEHNLLVLNSLDKLVALGFPTLLGTSRKSFIGKLSGKEVNQREFSTAATVALGIQAGIDIVRVHNVNDMLDVIQMSDAITRGWRPDNWKKS